MPPLSVNSSTKSRTVRRRVDMRSSAGMSISTLKWPLFAMIAPSFMAAKCSRRSTDLLPVTVMNRSPRGDLFVTLTGNKSVVRREHFAMMKDGAIVANSGHFNVEIDIPALERMSSRRRTLRPFVEEFTLRGGKKICLLGEGRLINLAAAEGHPAMVMDMSFANQSLSLEYLKKKAKTLGRNVHVVPRAIDMEVARLKLKTMGITIDVLTPEQERYLRSWSEGT